MSFAAAVPRDICGGSSPILPDEGSLIFTFSSLFEVKPWAVLSTDSVVIVPATLMGAKLDDDIALQLLSAVLSETRTWARECTSGVPNRWVSSVRLSKRRSKRPRSPLSAGSSCCRWEGVQPCEAVRKFDSVKIRSLCVVPVSCSKTFTALSNIDGVRMTLRQMLELKFL